MTDAKKAFTNDERAAIAAFCSLMLECAKVTEVPPKIFMGACAAAGKAMLNSVTGKPVNEGLDWMDADPTEAVTPQPGPAPKAFTI